jgi:hypothetical protein
MRRNTVLLLSSSFLRWYDTVEGGGGEAPVVEFEVKPSLDSYLRTMGRGGLLIFEQHIACFALQVVFWLNEKNFKVNERY